LHSGLNGVLSWNLRGIGYLIIFKQTKTLMK
jgi:hypothetical protein